MEQQHSNFLFNGQSVSVAGGRQVLESEIYDDIDDTQGGGGGDGSMSSSMGMGIPPLPAAPMSSSSPMRTQKSVLSMMNDSSTLQQGDDVNELWDEIEGFLNRPPPNINNKNGRSSGPVIPASQMSLPKLMKERSKLRKGQYAPPAPPNGTETGAGYVNNIRSKVKSGGNLKRTNNTVYGQPQKNNLDMSKVEEAMAYVDHLKGQNVQSAMAKDFGGLGINDNFDDGKGGSGGDGSQGGRKNRPNKAKNAKGGAAKKKNPNATRCAYGGGGNGNGRGRGRGGGRKNKPVVQEKGGFGAGQQAPESQAQLDYATLQENFEQGIALRKLQEELEASKQSMAQSRGAIQQAAQSWFQR